MAQRKYRLLWRENKNGRGAAAFGFFTVPAHIAQLLYEQNIQEFTVDLTEDGILYRPVVDGAPETVPSWLKKEG